MNLNERQHNILRLLQNNEQLEVDQLAERFAVSSQTVRKDINQMCDLGLVRRFHGGVMLPAATHNISFHSRELLRAEIKQQLAESIAQQIPNGSSIMLGIGTSVSHIARALLGHKNIRVLTNNLRVAAILCEQPDIEVRVSGGQLRHSDQDMVGEQVTRFLDDFYADYGIISAGALHPNFGIMEYDPHEADVSRAILRNCEQSMLVADQSKWRRRASVKVAPFSGVDVFTTDHLDASQKSVIGSQCIVTLL